MKKYVLSIFTALLAILLTGLVSEGSFAGSSKRFRKENGSRSNTAFAMSGMVTGSLRGTIHLGRSEVVLTEETRIYKTGKGMIRQGAFVRNTPVHVICVSRDGRTYATLVIISDRKNMRKGVAVRVLDPDEPQ
jgi:hypothetical protein